MGRIGHICVAPMLGQIQIFEEQSDGRCGAMGIFQILGFQLPESSGIATFGWEILGFWRGQIQVFEG